MNTKFFCISLDLGPTNIDPPEADAEMIEQWLEQKLSHVTSRFGGFGQVCVRVVEYGRVNVRVNFSVRGESGLEIFDKFRSDFQILEPISRGIGLVETSSFKLRFFTVEGEQLSAFVRVNPETGTPMGSSE